VGDATQRKSAVRHFLGRHEYNDRLPSLTPADLERRNAQRKATVAELSSIDRSKLPAAEIVNYDIFKRQIENAIESYDLGDYQMPINADSGFHTGFSRLPKDVPLATVKDYEKLHQPPERPGRVTCAKRSP